MPITLEEYALEFGEGKALQISTSILPVDGLDRFCLRNWAPYAWQLYGSGTVKMELGNYAPYLASDFDAGDLVGSTGLTTAAWTLDELTDTPALIQWPDFTTSRNERPLWYYSEDGEVGPSPVALYERKAYAQIAGAYVPFENTGTSARLTAVCYAEIGFTVRLMTPFLWKENEDDQIAYMALELSIDTEKKFATDEGPPFTGAIPEGYTIFEGSTADLDPSELSTAYDPEVSEVNGSLEVRDAVQDPEEVWGTVNLAAATGTNTMTADITLQVDHYYTGEPAH